MKISTKCVSHIFCSLKLINSLLFIFFSTHVYSTHSFNLSVFSTLQSHFVNSNKIKSLHVFLSKYFINPACFYSLNSCVTETQLIYLIIANSISFFFIPDNQFSHSYLLSINIKYKSKHFSVS